MQELLAKLNRYEAYGTSVTYLATVIYDLHVSEWNMLIGAYRAGALIGAHPRVLEAIGIAQQRQWDAINRNRKMEMRNLTSYPVDGI